MRPPAYVIGSSTTMCQCPRVAVFVGIDFLRCVDYNFSLFGPFLIQVVIVCSILMLIVCLHSSLGCSDVVLWYTLCFFLSIMVKGKNEVIPGLNLVPLHENT
jgi:hypothetical protein